MTERNHPLITRAQEQDLYKYLQSCLGDQPLRYELIAIKVQLAADGEISKQGAEIVKGWLDAMEEERAERANQVSSHAQQETLDREKARQDLRKGFAGNPNYQAFLDTLEQDELDVLTSNAPYLDFIASRQLEASRLCRNDVAAYIREWANCNLSTRVKNRRSPSQLTTSVHCATERSNEHPQRARSRLR